MQLKLSIFAVETYVSGYLRQGGGGGKIDTLETKKTYFFTVIVAVLSMERSTTVSS